MSESALFQIATFKSHSGLTLDWKIECDALTQDDWECLAYIASKILKPFDKIIPVPSGGMALANALVPYIDKQANQYLIVDDVLTTGISMAFQNSLFPNSIGLVAFARTYPPKWITPLFTLLAGYDDVESGHIRQ